MAYIVVFQLIRIDNDDYHFEEIDEEAIFLTKDIDKINKWAKSVIKNEMGNDYKEWLSAYNSGEWEKDDDKYIEGEFYRKDVGRHISFSMMINEIALIE